MQIAPAGAASESRVSDGWEAATAVTVGLVLAVWRGCRTYAPARCHSPSPPLPYPPYEHPKQRIFVVFLLKIIHSPRAPRGCNSGAPRLNTRSPRLPTAAMQNTAEQLWVGEGQTLYLSNEDLMFEWTTGFATRSKNLDSLCLDKIVRAHRQRCALPPAQHGCSRTTCFACARRYT